jgi:hypothetical protein
MGRTAAVAAHRTIACIVAVSWKVPSDSRPNGEVVLFSGFWVSSRAMTISLCNERYPDAPLALGIE